jgi:hypothetical protein
MINYGTKNLKHHQGSVNNLEEITNIRQLCPDIPILKAGILICHRLP